MRQIATLAPELARPFTDYLLTQEIETQLLPEGDQMGVWVRDEDQVERARQELATFQANPGDPRYLKATAVARTLRVEEDRAEEEYQRRQTQFNDQMREPGFVDLHTLTFGLIVISTLLTFASGFGSLTSSVTRTLEIAPIDVDGQFIRWEGLRAIERGEVWRLVTPIFLHFDLLHLVFNMLMLHSLGGLVERRRGWWRFLLLVLVLAVGSNLAEYYIEWSPAQSGLLQWKENPQFGGMSGVLYGLFGFAWMRGRFAPQQGMELSSQTVVVMLVWFVLCLAGIVGAVANMAHAGGLVLGIALGATALVWPGSRRSG